MKVRGGLLLLIALLALGGCESKQEKIQSAKATVSHYCLDCHNDIDRTAGLSLEARDLVHVSGHAALWEDVIRKVRAGIMPPVGGPLPSTKERDSFASFLENELDSAAAKAPNPGRTEPFHRLNRAEYGNAIRDLLGLKVDVSQLLPADSASYGFDNIAGVLKVSPNLLDRYLTAADQLSRLAVGRPAPFTQIDSYRMPDDRSQERRLPSMPFGTRGGMRIEYNFLRDAKYQIAVKLQRDLNEQVPLYADAQRLEIAVDGKRVALFTLPGVPETKLPPRPKPLPADPKDRPLVQVAPQHHYVLSRAGREARNHADDDWQVRVPVTAGRHVVTATFVNRSSALQETERLPFQRPYPAGLNMPETRTGAYLRSVEISGPYDATGPGQTASRKRIFVCAPEGTNALSARNLDCAERILATLARRAYRRDVNESDLKPLLDFYRQGAKDGFDAGIQLALKRLLVAPEFLFRIERDPPDVAPSAPYKLSQFELASRLSFFLWSSIPDDELLDAASKGKLSDPHELERQVDRMIADEKFDAFVKNFTGQWLYLRNLDADVPVQSVFPNFDDTLRQAMRRETELFFKSMVRDKRNMLDLLTADYTFLNGRLARHYGIRGVEGPQFRRVKLSSDSPRRGLLGQGSILTVTSYANRTSPTRRGKWILENLIGTPPPDPPPNVPGLTPTNGKGKRLTMRQQMEAHRKNPPCSTCHSLMDPLGFSLQNFDATGRWRTIGPVGQVIDASGGMPDGQKFYGVNGLRTALLANSNLFLQTMTEKLMTYALGRGLKAYDMPTVRKVVRDAAKDDNRFSAFVMGIVRSPAFQMRMSATAPDEDKKVRVSVASEKGDDE